LAYSNVAKVIYKIIYFQMPEFHFKPFKKVIIIFKVNTPARMVKVVFAIEVTASQSQNKLKNSTNR